MKDKNTNNISNNIFNGPTQITAGNNINDNLSKKALYSTTPVWRSPFTLGLLSWLSFFISFLSIFPLYKIFSPFIDFLNKGKFFSYQIDYKTYIVFIICLILLMLILGMRKITKNQTRYPLIFNYAISGLNNKITIEKVKIDKCPLCGGEMRYYNKPTEWRDILYNNGNIKRVIEKTTPALECKRNTEHWFKVDPAEDEI